MEYLLLLLGLTLLIFSGRILINNAVAIARRFHLSPFVIGMTVVAIGTSAPELLVSLSGVLKGHSDVAVYNIIGSNISNILLVLAIAAMILPIPVIRNTLQLEWPVMIAFSIIVSVFILDLRLSFFEGMILLILLLGFITFSLNRSRKDNADDLKENARTRSLRLALFLVLVSSAGLALGANLLVENAVILARKFHISDRIISVSLIAVGTSIPELATSAIAAFRKETDISIGNIIGSNIFNIGFVLGITGMIKPLDVNPLVLSFDIYWFLGAGIFLVIMIMTPRKMELQRWKGLTMLSVYLIYLYFVLTNNTA
jgi:cation:H+ antiporter